MYALHYLFVFVSGKGCIVFNTTSNSYFLTKIFLNQENEMNDALGHDSALKGYTGPWTTRANEMNFF